MNTLKSSRRTISPGLGRLCALVAMLSCTATYAQPKAGERSRPPEGRRAAQGDEPRSPRREFGPRNDAGDRRRQGPPGHPKSWNEIPEPQRRQVERFMEEHFPRLYLEMQQLKDRNEDRYARRMTRIGPEMRKIMETMRADPERGALMIRERQTEFQIVQTVARYRNAKDEDAKNRIREDLEGLVGEAFDRRNERRQMEVRELESRLNELRTRLSESEKTRHGLVRERVEELLERRVPLPDDEDSDDEESPRKAPGPESD